MGQPGCAPYSAAKAAVINLMESYYLNLKKYGIGVSVVCPTGIISNIGESTYTRPKEYKNTGYNVTDETLTVGTQFLPADQANLFDPSFPDRFILGPHETRVFEDVLHELFGYDSELKGSLLFTVDSSLIAGNPDGAKILAATRIYNTGDPAGTFGQTVPALSLTINAAGTPSVATGARHDSRYRSNLGIASLTLISDITVHYRVRTEDGSVLREGSRELQPSSMSQWSFQQLGVPVTEGPLTVELWLDPSDVLPDPCATNFPNMFIAYVSKVDGGTGDAEFIYAAPNEPYDCPRQ